MRQKTSNTALQDALLGLAARSVGFSTSEVSGFTPKQIGPAAESLVKAGRLFRAKLSHKVVRYFSTETMASAYLSGHLRPPVALSVTLPRKSKAPWPKDAPMHITPETKFTIAPPPPSGYYKTNTHSR